MLRAAYFGQELLSTFGNSIGEVALIPATGGLFTVLLTYQSATSAEVQEVLLWDRKAEDGFPETKILKQRVRNHIEPEKNLGHSDTPSRKAAAVADVSIKATGQDVAQAMTNGTEESADGTKCEDCK
jgi:predicted Rdx family selenoprotein